MIVGRAMAQQSERVLEFKWESSMTVWETERGGEEGGGTLVLSFARLWTNRM